MAFTITTVNGGAGRVVLGADGRPAHVIELGPLYIRIDLSGGFEQVEPLARGGYGAVMIDMPPMIWATYQRRSYQALAAQWELHAPTQAALTSPDPPPGQQLFPDDVATPSVVRNRKRGAGTLPSPAG